MGKEITKWTTVFLSINVVLYVLYKFLLYPNLDTVNAVLNIETVFAINAAASFIICACIIYLKDMFETQIGFIFLGFSVLKMIAFFIFLNPTGLDGKVLKADAISFFIPYGVNLVLEIAILVKALNISDLAKVTSAKQ